MRALLDRLANALHGSIAVATIALLASGPWLAMYHRVPEPAGALNLAHVIVGLLVVPLSVAYVLACTLVGRWRLYFPWLAGQFRGIGADLKALARAQRPGSEGGGLFATIEGLLLAALLATAGSGLAWWLLQGADAAVVWRGLHALAARTLAALLVAHVVAVALHLVDLVRD
jgi:cytochrome b561